jgi:hypothetical protein
VRCAICSPVNVHRADCRRADFAQSLDTRLSLGARKAGSIGTLKSWCGVSGMFPLTGKDEGAIPSPSSNFMAVGRRGLGKPHKLLERGATPRCCSQFTQTHAGPGQQRTERQQSRGCIHDRDAAPGSKRPFAGGIGSELAPDAKHLTRFTHVKTGYDCCLEVRPVARPNVFLPYRFGRVSIWQHPLTDTKPRAGEAILTMRTQAYDRGRIKIGMALPL